MRPDESFSIAVVADDGLDADRGEMLCAGLRLDASRGLRSADAGPAPLRYPSVRYLAISPRQHPCQAADQFLDSEHESVRAGPRHDAIASAGGADFVLVRQRQRSAVPVPRLLDVRRSFFDDSVFLRRRLSAAESNSR